MNDCSICYNEIDTIIKCNYCSINKEDPKNICNKCVLKLNISDSFLLKNDNLIEDDSVKQNEKYDNILVLYNCPFCKNENDFKITNIIDINNSIKLSIILLKKRIIQSYKNDEFTNNVVQENNILKDKLKRLENRLNIINLFNEKYYIILVIVIVNFCLLLLFTIMTNIFK